jgi:hypothetical protein
MRVQSTGICLLAVVLALATAACGGSTPAPSVTSPTMVAADSTPLPPVWDNDVRTGGLPGGLDGETIFVIDAAKEPIRLEGVVTAVRGTCPNIGLRVNDRIVRTFERTAFEGQRCAAIAVRDRVVIVGRPINDELFGALRVASRKP